MKPKEITQLTSRFFRAHKIIIIFMLLLGGRKKSFFFVAGFLSLSEMAHITTMMNTHGPKQKKRKLLGKSFEAFHVAETTTTTMARVFAVRRENG